MKPMQKMILQKLKYNKQFEAVALYERSFKTCINERYRKLLSNDIQSYRYDMRDNKTIPHNIKWPIGWYQKRLAANDGIFYIRSIAKVCKRR